MTKQFGFWTLTFLVIANMIGAGVFTTSGFSLQDLGTPELVVCAWTVGGAIAIAGAASYGFLARALPESGGEYLFLSRAAHPLLGFIAGWVSLIAGFSGAIAFAATAFESYLVPELSRPTWLPIGSVAIIAIVVAGGLHGLKPRFGAWTQNLVVLTKLVLLVGILLFAASKLPFGTAIQWDALPERTSSWNQLSTFASSLVWISLSYSGFNAAIYVASEVENAARVVPRSLVCGTSFVAVLYILLNSIFVYSAEPDVIKGQPDVAAVAARAIGGPSFELFVRWTIILCLLTSVFSMMMAAPRVYAKMADDGLLPGWLRFQGARPQFATIMQIVLAVLLVLISDLRGLLDYLGLTLSLSAACSVACLFLPSIRRTALSHPSQLIIPGFFIASTLLAAVMMTIMNPWQLLGTAVTFALGFLAYGIRLWSRRPPSDVMNQ